MQLKDLAAGLGISPAMVSKLKRRGMPVDSVEAAEKWRKRHLLSTRTKGVRAGSERMPISHGHVSTPGDGSRRPTAVDGRTARLLRIVEELGVAALDSIQRDAFSDFAPVLRQAMAQVPPGAHDLYRLPIEVWDALTEAVPDVSDPSGSSAHAAAGELDDAFMGEFFRQIALGPQFTDMCLDMTEAEWKWTPRT